VERKRDAGELVLAVERREGEKGKIFVNPPEDFLLIPSDWMFVIAPAEEKP
jgi:hypothetical protein